MASAGKSATLAALNSTTSSGGAHAKIKKKAAVVVANRREGGGAQFYSTGQTVRVGGGGGNNNNNPSSNAAAGRKDGDVAGVGVGAVARAGSRRVSTARDPSVLVQAQVEYWQPATGKWAEGGVVKVKKDEALLELPSGARGDSFRFLLDHSLRVEHSTPLSRDFHLVLTGSGGRHRVAVYSEGEGQDLIKVLRTQGAQVVRRRVLPPCLPPPRPPNRPNPAGLRPISEGQVLHVSRQEEDEDDEMTLIRRKSTGSSDPDIQRVRKSGDLPRSSSTGIKDASSPPWFKLGPEEEGRGLSTGSTRKSNKRQQRSDQSLNSDEVSSGSFHQDDHREMLRHGSDSSLATASSDDGVFGINILRRSSSAKREDEDEDETSRADDEKLERYKFMLVNIEEDPSMLDPSELDGEYRRCDFDDYPDLTLPEGAPDTPDASSAAALGQVPRWIRKSFEELDLDVSVTEHRKRSRESPTTRHNRHRYLRQSSSMLERSSSVTSSEASSSLSRLESVESPTSPPPPPLPPRPPLLKQTSSSKRKGKKHKRPVMLFTDEGDGRSAEEV